jgi:hypothetical protein
MSYKFMRDVVGTPSLGGFHEAWTLKNPIKGVKIESLRQSHKVYLEVYHIKCEWLVSSEK